MGGRLMRRIKLGVLSMLLLFVGIFLWHTDFDAVYLELKQLRSYLVHIFLVTATAYLLSTWSWKLCLGPSSSKVGIWQLFCIRQVCETVALFNPASVIGGDLLKAYYLQRHQIEEKCALASVALSRLAMVLSQILLFTTSCLWLLSTSVGDFLSAGLKTGLTGILTTLIFAKAAVMYWMARPFVITTPTKSTGGLRRIREAIRHFFQSLRETYQKDQSAFWNAYAIALLHWVVGSLEFFVILRALGFDVTIMHGVLLDMSVIIFKSLGAFVPGQLGVEELGNKFVLAALGISSATIWISVSLIRRARQIFWAGIGFILYLIMKKSSIHVRIV